MSDDINSRLYARWNREVQEVVLQKFTFMVGQAISRDLIQDFQGELSPYLVQQSAEVFLFHIRAEILGETLEKKSATYPSTWRDQVKIALYNWLGWPGCGHWPWLAAYARKRWPIEYTTLTLEARALYPKISLPDRGAVMKYIFTTEKVRV